jgi:hypothetical protein
MYVNYIAKLLSLSVSSQFSLHVYCQFWYFFYLGLTLHADMIASVSNLSFQHILIFCKLWFIFEIWSTFWWLEFTIICFCSDAGEIYAKKLANFVEKRLKSEKAASVSLHQSSWLTFSIVQILYP